MEYGIKIDEFGRANGVEIYDKPIGITSHDVVDIFRKKYSTKKVGHAGALDPFASGLLIILVGKATKLQDKFLHMDKTYEADVLFGVSTNSGDPEGDLLKTSDIDSLDEDILKKSLDSFQPKYKQFVPIFSSVKVQGNKLRVLARENDSFEIEEKENFKFVNFISDGKIQKTLEIPFREVNIYEIELLKISKFNKDDFADVDFGQVDIKNRFVAKIKVSCSKGTYIRQLAEDIGQKYGELVGQKSPSMLVGLRRTRVGKFELE